MTSLADLLTQGQSIWIDYIERDFIKKGELQRLIDQGVRGLTSNPAIFQKAITEGDAYDADLIRFATSGLASQVIFEKLAITDIQDAADLFRDLYENSQGEDGFVSLEVSPELADDAEATIREAKRLHQEVSRPNLMIKVPATPAGITAIRALIAEGINVNVTLIFGAEQYVAAALAFIEGLEQRLAAHQSVHDIASVASFFVSRLDAAVDPLLEQKGFTQWQGKAAIANAANTYDQFLALFSGERWERLAQAGGKRQRLLWASTGTKNKRYPDTLYIDALIGKHTVNTIPPATLKAVFDHGSSVAALPGHDMIAFLNGLTGIGVHLNEIIARLQQDGVAAFQKAYQELLQSIEKKRGI